MKLTKQQSAELLGVTERTIQRAVSDGRLPADREGGRLTIDAGDLERLKSWPTRDPIISMKILMRNLARRSMAE
jgi:excisionase family DNA binding protein